MIVGKRRWVEYKRRSDTFNLWAWGDWHIGNRGYSHDRLARDIAEFQELPNAFWIGMGDYADYIAFNDKRFDPQQISPDITVADMGQLGKVLMHKVRDMMLPVKDRCVGLLYGNHEDKYMTNTSAQQWQDWLCCDLDTQDLGYSCFLDLIFHRNSKAEHPGRLLTKRPEGPADSYRVRIFAHHGAGAARTPGGKLNKLIQAMDYSVADLVFLAHVHDVTAKRVARIGVDENATRIVEHETVGAISGSYLRTYAPGPAGYGEQKLYRPVVLGPGRVTIHPNERRIQAVI